MKVLKVHVNRKFNLGNYESLEVGVEAEVSEGENFLALWTSLSDSALLWFEGEKSKLQPQKRVVPAAQKPDLGEKPLTTGLLADMFPAELRKAVVFREGSDHVRVATAGFLAKQDWQAINDLLKESFNAKYVSAGKDSHWWVPK